ncbi:unnamed protein product, partial [Rotaria socialis]
TGQSSTQGSAGTTGPTSETETTFPTIAGSKAAVTTAEGEGSKASTVGAGMSETTSGLGISLASGFPIGRTSIVTGSGSMLSTITGGCFCYRGYSGSVGVSECSASFSKWKEMKSGISGGVV